MKQSKLVLIAVAALSLLVYSFTGKPAAYKVDAAKSKLTWKGKKVTGEHTGNINLSNGVLNLEGSQLKGGSFEIDTRTITNTDITDKDNNAKLIGHLKSDDFFATDKYPKATLVITSVNPNGASQYNVKGNLTIKGITNEVSFPATIAVNNNQLTANAKITIDRTKYNIKFRSKSFFENLGDKVIYDDFDLDVTLVATAQ